MSPLHLAVSTGNVDLVKDLLTRGADVNARSNPSGLTPLHLNVSGLTDDDNRQEIIKVLVEAGADLEAKSLDRGLTPLQQAAMNDRPHCVSTLLACGATVNAAEANGGTALHFAAYLNHTEVAKVLLKNGANPDMPDNHGNTPSSLAQSAGLSTIQNLLNS